MICKYYEVVLYPERERGERRAERGEGYREERGRQREERKTERGDEDR
jgi:hypothetical protein